MKSIYYIICIHFAVDVNIPYATQYYSIININQYNQFKLCNTRRMALCSIFAYISISIRNVRLIVEKPPNLLKHLLIAQQRCLSRVVFLKTLNICFWGLFILYSLFIPCGDCVFERVPCGCLWLSSTLSSSGQRYNQIIHSIGNRRASSKTSLCLV